MCLIVYFKVRGLYFQSKKEKYEKKRSFDDNNNLVKEAKKFQKVNNDLKKEIKILKEPRTEMKEENEMLKKGKIEMYCKCGNKGRRL